jgi:choline-sulfatase
MQMKGLVFILIIVFFLFGCSEKRTKIKPNILFITTDCQSWEDMPGITPVLKMPALEKLRNGSVVFENHYSVAPISMPARYSIISGRYPHYHKMMDDGGNWLPEHTPLLMEKLSMAGYQTVGIGKMHFKPWERSAGFDFRIIADCQGSSSSDTLKHDDYYFYLRKAGFSRWDYLKHLNDQGVYGIYQWPMNDTLDIDYFVGNETAKLLKSDKLKNDSPWFLWVSFNGPHYPWDSPDRYTEKYLNSVLPEARCRENELNEKPSGQSFTRNSFSKNIAEIIDEQPNRQGEIVKRIRAGHYGNLTQIDGQIEKILETLKLRNDFNNTIIIFSSVHGALLGDHQNFQGGNFYERSSHVPFVVCWPGHYTH